MALEKIVITIAGKSFPLNVESSKQEMYRLAERTLNSSIERFEQRNFEGMGRQEAVAFVAFEQVVANIALRQRSELDSEEALSLKAIDDRIESYLNDLSRERQ